MAINFKRTDSKDKSTATRNMSTWFRHLKISPYNDQLSSTLSLPSAAAQMGCAQSTGIDEQAKTRNAEIENQLKRDRMVAKNEIKMLLLGAGESGKSTVLKQMKLIHHGGYNEQERDSPCALSLEALPHLDITLDPQNDACRNIILSLPSQIEGDVLPRNVSEAISTLWRDPAIREAVSRSREFQLNDSAIYYFNAMDRMSTADYLPTDQDILRSRVKTTGITETTFKIGELTYKLFDVGGQRSERKKWIHCFENVTALVFLVSLSEYDQMLYEDESVILFLNKIDLFAEKISRSPLSDYFPDYTGGDNYDAACEYLLRRFVSLNQSAATKQIYAHYTCATDTQQINRSERCSGYPPPPPPSRVRSPITASPLLSVRIALVALATPRYAHPANNHLIMDTLFNALVIAAPRI
ncbi:Guanine nucleotide-binding protein subunit alpha [Termitomyces sp. Mi166|nr:Guanine nucleotide-binding protein subunit alpha [Termitomyces sp. Mi166\